MNVTYTQRELVNVKGQMEIEVEVTGIITYDDAEDCRDWFHNGMKVVKMKMWTGDFKPISGDSAKLIYNTFCGVWSAKELAAIHC